MTKSTKEKGNYKETRFLDFTKDKRFCGINGRTKVDHANLESDGVDLT